MNGNTSSKVVREEVLKLIEQKEELENEIHELQKILTKNGVGMDDPLVDNEGFPLANIDIYQVRHARHLLICKQNDHKHLMKQIEQGISEYYEDATVKEQVQKMEIEPQGTSRHAEPTLEQAVEHTRPFAIINVVHEGSPADAAGIKNRDLIVEFGSLNATNFRAIEDIGKIVHHSRGTAVNVKIKRGERFMRVHLVPREWNGRGLLGCNVLAI